MDQLQYINWSYNTADGGSSTRNVTSANYRTYPYLQYTRSAAQHEQTQEEAIAGDGIGGPRPIQSWTQTHDLNGTDLKHQSEPEYNRKLQPIAGSVFRATSDNYNVILYAWFGGVYDGQSYYIKNIRIDSYCYNVGVFGTTAGAEIRNIVLYSDNQSVIQRATQVTPDNIWIASEDAYKSSYALGGLVGIAYDYKQTRGQGTIENCAIAGYTIRDNSKNAQQLGEAAVGGLIGVSSVNLKRCSAVVDIEVNCTHRNSAGELVSAKWGNYVRVGGLAGGVQYTVTDCYTGGSIKIGNDLLKERVAAYGDKTDALDGTTEQQVYMTKNGVSGPDTYVYIGGLGGSGFAANFQNFTNKTDGADGNPEFYNCYTYMDFPNMEGTITGISLIGSLADRYGGWILPQDDHSELLLSGAQ